MQTTKTVDALPRDETGLPRGRTLMHARDSVTRRVSGDVRSALMAGSVFTLQVAHPLVSAGVAEHSMYKEDPWTRLRDVDASGRRFLWIDEASARAEGARLRHLHKDIRGVGPDGKRYHALDPHGYGWVHMVFLDTMVRQTELFGDPLTRADEERLFLEWYEGALFFGIRDKDLPQSLAEYRARFDHALRYELEHTSVVAELLGDKSGLARPRALRRVPRAAWHAVVRPLHARSQWLALACLPPAYRARVPYPWTTHDEARFQSFCLLVRRTFELTPTSWWLLPDARRIERDRSNGERTSTSARTSAP
jgi:uncharacterized protein (DUF2236 family)